MKTIEIKCKGSMELELDELVPFQGDLKELSKENYNKLRKSILELGFSAPCFVWKHNKSGEWKILDSHQRVRVLTELRNSEGYTIPKLPCVEIHADNEHEAKKKLLAITSNYGQITSDGLFSFASQANIDLPTLEDFRFPEIDMVKWKQEFFEDILPVEFPELKTDEERPEFSQMTFTLHRDQVEIVKQAIEASREIDVECSTKNENSNGNALEKICKFLLENI